MLIFNALQTSLSAGIGRTSYGMAESLYKTNNIKMKIVIREEDIELFNFVKKDDLIIAKGIDSSIKRNYYEQFILPRIARKKYEDVIIYFADTMGPIFSSTPFIITINDLAFKTLKKSFSWKSNLWKNIITDLSVKRAKHIITISEFSKSEVLKYYRYIKNEDVTAIHIGFNNFSKDKIDLSYVRSEIKEKSNKKYIFTVSTISPRKNMHRLVQAFNLLKDNIEENLIISGKNGWLYDEVYNLVEKYNLHERVIFTGEINDEELKYLYKNCKLFVYPSLYEGFGLPPLEALSYGKKVVVSNITVTKEILENNVYYFDPYNEQDIANNIKIALQESINDEQYKYKVSKLLNRYKWCDFGWKFKELYNRELTSKL